MADVKLPMPLWELVTMVAGLMALNALAMSKWGGASLDSIVSFCESSDDLSSMKLLVQLAAKLGELPRLLQLVLLVPQ